MSVSAHAALPFDKPDSNRLQFLDLLRALAAQLIVWHHLAFYGPLSHRAWHLAPRLLVSLHSHARMAVQVFLVVGGFVAAQHLAKLNAACWRNFGHEISRRYRRIGGPYLVVLIMAVAANALADLWIDHRSISAQPTLGQFLAHIVFAQDVLGYEALSAGVWYLSIDFQLFALTLALATLIAKLPLFANTANGVNESRRALQWVLALLAVCSLFWFNRVPALDVWAVYFLGSYFLGMLLHWVLSGAMKGRALTLYFFLIGIALAVEWRPRLLVAAGTAGLILLAARSGRLQGWPANPLVTYLGKTSFSLFLVHFPTCLVVSAWLLRDELSPEQALGGMVLAWAASMGMSALLYRFVELPCLRLVNRNKLSDGMPMRHAAHSPQAQP